MPALWYETQPTRIRAVQWTGNNMAEVSEAFPGIIFSRETNKVYDAIQKTWISVFEGDWIIQGTEGEFYPCANTVFQKKYRLADRQETWDALLRRPAVD